jgi:hypothetical protein
MNASLRDEYFAITIFMARNNAKMRILVDGIASIWLQDCSYFVIATVSNGLILC